VKRYVREAGSVEVGHVLAQHAVATSRLSEVEVASALERRCREGDLPRPDRDRALAALPEDLGSIYVVELSPEVSARALGLLVRHALRAGDAIQLASCLRLQQEAGVEVQFLAYDTQLGDAARAEGLALLS